MAIIDKLEKIIHTLDQMNGTTSGKFGMSVEDRVERISTQLDEMQSGGGSGGGGSGGASVMTVTIVKEDSGTPTKDKTFNEIKEHYLSGGAVVCRFKRIISGSVMSDKVLPLAICENNTDGSTIAAFCFHNACALQKGQNFYFSFEEINIGSYNDNDYVAISAIEAPANLVT